MNKQTLSEIIPPSPMRFKRCGECGCAEHRGARGTGHSTACSKFDLGSVTIDREQLVTSPEVSGPVRVGLDGKVHLTPAQCEELFSRRMK